MRRMRVSVCVHTSKSRGQTFYSTPLEKLVQESLKPQEIELGGDTEYVLKAYIKKEKKRKK